MTVIFIQCHRGLGKQKCEFVIVVVCILCLCFLSFFVIDLNQLG